MSDEVKYDRHYRDDPAACGAPFAELRAFCDGAEPGSVLDLGCGQGREGVVSDIRTFEPGARFDVVILDRVLHMLPADARDPVLARAMEAVTPGGHLLVAEGPKGMIPVRASVERVGWSLVIAKANRLIARRPGP
mgnify:CR=1 FL=1